MKFSVIIPSRNRLDDVRRALESVCSQTYQNIEILVVNDGSDDDVREHYERLPEQLDSRIKLIHLAHTRDGHGASFSRNMGVFHSTGDYILFLDDDDIWTDTAYIQRLHDALTHYDKKVDAFFSHQQAANDKGELNNRLWLSSYCRHAREQGLDFDQFGFFKVDVSDLLRFNGFAHLNGTAVSRQVFEKMQGFDNSVMYENDRDFFLRLIDTADTLLCSDAIVARHHIPDPSRKANVSTKPNLLRKMQFREYFLNKLMLFGNKEAVRQSARTDKVYTLKQMASLLYQNKQYPLACHYASEALLIGFNLKWLAFTFWLWILSCKARLIQKTG